MHVAEKAPQLTLARKQFTGKIAHMCGVNLARLNAGGREGCFGRIAEQLEHPAAFTRQIASEITLRATQYKNRFCHFNLLRVFAFVRSSHQA
jgi:hypothetical protein